MYPNGNDDASALFDFVRMNYFASSSGAQSFPPQETLNCLRPYGARLMLQNFQESSSEPFKSILTFTALRKKMFSRFKDFHVTTTYGALLALITAAK
jgi:hypothetical protein